MLSDLSYHQHAVAERVRRFDREAMSRRLARVAPRPGRRGRRSRPPVAALQDGAGERVSTLAAAARR